MLVIYDRKKKSKMPTIFKTRPFGCFLGLLFLFASITNGADEYRFRTWVDSTGKFKIEAQFKETKGNNIVLLQRDGILLELKLIKLSKRDNQYVQAVNRGKEPPAAFDDVAKVTPFVFDASKGLKAHRHTITYPWKVDAKETVVEFKISGNGNRDFPSSTKNQQPVALGKQVKYEVRLAPKAAGGFDFAADVTANMSYDSKKGEFIIYVSPYAEVIRGRAGSIKIPLSPSQCEQRAVSTVNTIELFTRQIKDILPAQITALEREHGALKLRREAALRVMNFQAAGVFGTQMNQLEVKWKGLRNQMKSKSNRIPALKFDQQYLTELAAKLIDLDTITVEYSVFSKVGDHLELILDGTLGKTNP